MATVEILIEADNAAFGDTREERNTETVRILKLIIQDLEANHSLPYIVRDLNGNRVGRVAVVPFSNMR